MTPTTRQMILRCLAVGEDAGHHEERLPWSLIQDLCRYGLDDAKNDPDDKPGDGIGVLCLLVPIANWGVKPAPTRAGLGPDGDVVSPVGDPAGDYWRGRPPRSGKHFSDGGKMAPYGGLGIAHLDSGALEDVYERWGWPTHKGSLMVDDRPIAFDTLRRRNDSTWARWLEWASDLVTSPEFAVWSALYWLDEFWRKPWSAAWESFAPDVTKAAASAATVARFKNSAKYAADRYLGQPADVVAKAYLDYKQRTRGDKAVKRTKRQLSYVERLPILVDLFTIRGLT